MRYYALCTANNPVALARRKPLHVMKLLRPYLKFLLAEQSRVVQPSQSRSPGLLHRSFTAGSGHVVSALHMFSLVMTSRG